MFGGIKFAFRGIKFAFGEIKIAFVEIKFAFGEIKILSKESSFCKRLLAPSYTVQKNFKYGNTVVSDS